MATMMKKSMTRIPVTGSQLFLSSTNVLFNPPYAGSVSSRYTSKPMAAKLSQTWDAVMAEPYASTMVVLARTDDPRTDELITEEPRIDELSTEMPSTVESPIGGTATVRKLTALSVTNKDRRSDSLRSNCRFLTRP